MNISAIFEEIDKKATYIPDNSVSGSWKNIQLSIDSMGQEYLNIGVLFQHKNCLYYDFIEDLSAFNCLYGKSYDTEGIKFLIGALKKQIALAPQVSLDDFLPISSAVRLTPKGMYQGKSVSEVVSWLSFNTMTLARRQKESKQKSFIPINSELIQQEVFEHLRIKLDLKADRIILPDGVYIKDDDDSHNFDLSILTSDQIAAITSAWYKTWNTIESNIMKSQFNLGTFPDSNKLGNAVFLCRPSSEEGIDKNELGRIDNGIDHYHWMLKKADIFLEVEDSTEKIADRIIEWAHI